MTNKNIPTYIFVAELLSWLLKQPKNYSQKHKILTNSAEINYKIANTFWHYYKLEKSEFHKYGIFPEKNESNNKWFITLANKKTHGTNLYQYLPPVIDKNSIKVGDIKLKFTDKLLSFQINHVEHLVTSLINLKAVLDASDTGTGKTYCAISCAKELNLKPFIICPKSVMPSWVRACKYFNIDPVGIINYEKLKTGKTKFLIPHVKNHYEWKIPNDSLIIFDEAHKCKNYGTKNSKMLISAKRGNRIISCLSATVADSPLKMYPVGLVLGLFPNKSQYNSWCADRGVTMGRFGPQFTGGILSLREINKEIFPFRGHRMNIKELGDQFPETKITAELYNMGNKTKHINTLAVKIERLMKSAKKQSSILTEIIKLRQALELEKIETIIELAQDGVEENNSVVIMLNFNDSVDTAIKLLTDGGIKCSIVRGGQDAEKREKNIQDFQNNINKVIVCNIRSGGLGISLHDIDGNHPRLCLISPNYSAQDIVQAVGRVWRVGGKSKSIQKIVYCDGTIEETICNKLAAKINNISTINEAEVSKIFSEFSEEF